jgi:endonuclease/exonuclease/phosphatase family metal-dependent hydrolase
MGFTFPVGRRPFPPVVRLDYVFHDDHFRTLSAHVWQDSGGSDHLPVIASLALVEN